MCCRPWPPASRSPPLALAAPGLLARAAVSAVVRCRSVGPATMEPFRLALASPPAVAELLVEEVAQSQLRAVVLAVGAGLTRSAAGSAVGSGSRNTAPAAAVHWD